MAEACGENEVADTCRKILGQEEATAHKLDGLIEPVSNTYLEREAAASAEAAS
jgi:ferritin-like metal-binding protein YciE